MFRQPDFSNLRFTIIQAVNPYIQSSSNKFIGKAVSFLPNKKTKVVLNLPKKLLGKNLKLTNHFLPLMMLKRTTGGQLYGWVG